ncbi:hypothetical protein EYF80_012666 [Liparis tanakae]|uniref:Uncharacterized protein n=1 Tax=Liparis tanakae TaxID=230148 RepID=A0A4Z2IGP8_9TELE|nr:hypothetical protein EYF80_012666 [Liparis tanakae]
MVTAVSVQSGCWLSHSSTVTQLELCSASFAIAIRAQCLSLYLSTIPRATDQLKTSSRSGGDPGSQKRRGRRDTTLLDKHADTRGPVFVVLAHFGPLRGARRKRVRRVCMGQCDAHQTVYAWLCVVIRVLQFVVIVRYVRLLLQGIFRKYHLYVSVVYTAVRVPVRLGPEEEQRGAARSSEEQRGAARSSEEQ